MFTVTNSTKKIGIQGFVSVHIRRQFDSIGGNYKIFLVNQVGDDFPYALNDQLIFEDTGTLLMNAFLDRVEVIQDSKRLDITLSGSEILNDLTTSTCPDLVFSNNSTIENVLRRVLDALSIDVRIIAPDGLKPLTNIDNLQTNKFQPAFDWLNNLFYENGFLFRSNSKGEAVIQKFDDVQEPISIVDKQITIKYVTDLKDRYNKYTLYGQNSSFKEDFVDIKVTSTDEGVRSSKQLNILADSAIDTDFGKTQVDWINNLRQFRNQKLFLNMAGIIDPNGNLWETGSLISYKNSKIGLTQLLMIRGLQFIVTLNKDKIDVRTLLELIPAEAFTGKTQGRKSENRYI